MKFYEFFDFLITKYELFIYLSIYKKLLSIYKKNIIYKRMFVI